MGVLVLLFALGTAAAPESPPLELLVDRRWPAAAGVRLGDTVRLRAVGGAWQPAVVVGIFERPADPSRLARNAFEVRLHLPDWEGLGGPPDAVDRVAVRVRAGADTAALRAWLETTAVGLRVVPTAAVAEASGATFRVIARFQRAIAAVALGAAGVFLACVLLLRVEARRHDWATLRLLGVRAGTLRRAVLLEALGVAAVGTVLGLAGGWGAVNLVNAYYARVYDTSVRFAVWTPAVAAQAALLGLGLGVLAGAWAAWRLGRLPPLRLGERG